MDDRDAQRDVEQWLDVALGQYAKAEPRVGLEGRVLARIRSEREQSAQVWRWGRSWFAVAAAAALALGWFLFGRLTVGQLPHAPVAKVAGPPRVGAGRGEASGGVRSGRPHDSRRGAGATRPSKPPKLDQFPSPAPLNEQERMLARYVQEFSERAALVARAQTDLRKQNEREMAAPWRKNSNSTGLDQPE